ncbi:hypothetical protein Scep_008102 [Stephania cephalantha]|uniref:MMS19 nucleotide excision repair protein n=1 Tax=Stephania cephalantha TaxID=152367 RepID=A0AAP0KCB5_9MAGN
MAKPTSWIPHIEAFVDSSRPADEQNAGLEAIALMVKRDLLTLEALVIEMELYLTTTDHVLRARGILLLGELLACLATKPLDSKTVHSLTEFFTEKLADWHALHGALIGCLALLRRKNNVGAVTNNDAKALTQSYLQNIHVQSLGKRDRKLSLELLDFLLDHYSDIVASLGHDLFYGICQAIDGEMDPDCLMLTFHLVAVLGQVFPDPFGPLAGFAEDLFDILSRYFPIHFTHQNDDFDVKRDDLSKALMLAFASTSLFEPFAIPLLLEKLSSSLTLAKVDSLKYLSYLSVKYGADRMAKHASTIWSSLKGAIFTSYQEPIISRISDLADCKGPENEIAREALLCLQKFMLQDDGLFLDMVLEDQDIEQVLRSIAGFKSYNDMTMESKQKVHALGCILAASAKFSGACCNRVFQKLLPQLMDILGYFEENSARDCISGIDPVQCVKLNFGALYLCAELLAACRDLLLCFEGEFDNFVLSIEDTCFLLGKFLGQLTGAFCSTLITVTEQEICEAHIYCGVKGLLTLATFRSRFSPIPKSVFETVLNVFMSVITSSLERTLVWKNTLKAIVQIGIFLQKFSDSEREASYMAVVVEKIASLICHNDSPTPLLMLLEAVSDIGATCQKFMLRVNQGMQEAISTNLLEASVWGVEGNSKVDVLVPLLECYARKVLQWFLNFGGVDGVALDFSIKIWSLIESSRLFDVGLKGKADELLNKMMITMRLAVAGCSVGSQVLIVQKAICVISSSPFFSSKKDSEELSVPSKLEELQLNQEFPSYSCRDEWIISLFASVVVALRPQTPLQNLAVLLRLFTCNILRGHVPSAQALGSIVNKLPSNNREKLSSFTVEEALNIISGLGLFGNIASSKCHTMDINDGGSFNLGPCEDKCDSIQSNAIVGLAWVGKGLVMRGHGKLNDIVMILLRCLLSTDETRKPISQNHLSVGLGGENAHPCVVDAFRILLHDSDVCLSKRFHATIRPLYKQHFFSSIMPILLSLIKESNSSTSRSMLYRAFGHITSETPLAAVVVEAKQLIFVLLDSMSMLSVDVMDKDLTYSLLLVLSGILLDENGREAVTENAHIVTDVLVQLVSYPHMMLVRETAIQCLFALALWPYTRIYPMRKQVLDVLSKAVDDPKRTVRQEAVRCQQAWASIASRSLR